MTVTEMHSAAAPILPEHHIPAELLLDYASGSLGEAWSLVVACHLTLCPHCRAELAAIEALGGRLLEEMPPQPMQPAGFAAIAARLGPQEPAPDMQEKTRQQKVRPQPEPAAGGGLPAPLRAYLSGGVDRIPWRWSGAGLHAFALPVQKARGGMASLLRIAPGTGMPRHSHAGEEMTLVLSGGFTDDAGAFRRGDVEIADGSTEHRPVAMAGEPCICLAVTDAPLRFSGSFGWILNQWSKLSS
ncbi:ChrR family anti-sigma-E factor [Ferrovibrio sp.]|uniref:ChrR family anti-sigma-E factor n=1 Tax=Ferrovibrio sp. TaxID=1917215 RepID=UPI00311FC860